MTGFYVNGKKNGEFRFYYPDGNLRMIINYQNDQRTGVWEEFYINGNLKIKVLYDNGFEKLLAVNDSTGNSLVKRKKFKYTTLFYEVPYTPLHNTWLKTNEELLVKGKVVNSLRRGKWTFLSNGLIKITAKYRKGELRRAFYVYQSIHNFNKTSLTNHFPFPLFTEPFKFVGTENFFMNPGSVIKNNYVVEGLHWNQFITDKKISVKSRKELEEYIFKNFKVLGKKNLEKIIINITVLDGKIVEVTTHPKMTSNAIDELNLILDNIEKIEFCSNEVITIEYLVDSYHEIMGK